MKHSAAGTSGEYKLPDGTNCPLKRHHAAHWGFCFFIFYFFFAFIWFIFGWKCVGLQDLTNTVFNLWGENVYLCRTLHYCLCGVRVVLRCCCFVFFPSSFLIRYTTSIYFSWENEDLLLFFFFPTRKPYLDTRHFSRCPEVYVVFKVKRNRFGYQKKKRKTETDTDDSFTPKRRPWAKPRPTKPFPKTVKW